MQLMVICAKPLKAYNITTGSFYYVSNLTTINQSSIAQSYDNI